MKALLKYKILLIILVSLSFSNKVNAVTVWLENFTGLADGTTVDAGATAWTRDISAADFIGGDHAEVRSNRFQINDPDEPVYWYSATIDITGYTNIGLSIDLTESGDLEGTDVIISQYSLGGGAWTNFATNGSMADDFGTAISSQTGLNGATIRIRVSANNSANDEFYTIDNITVTGTVALPSCNPCYSIANGNFNAASTWSATSGGAAVGGVPANNGTVSFFIERGYTVNLNVDYSILNLTAGVNGNGTLNWTAGNVQLDINSGGTVRIASGSKLDENGQTNADIVFKSGGFNYNLVVNDAVNGLKIDNVYLQNAAKLTISGTGLINISNDLIFIEDDGRITNDLTGSFTTEEIVFGNWDGGTNTAGANETDDHRNYFLNNQTINVTNRVYFFVQGHDDTLVNNGTINTADFQWEDDGETATPNIDGYVLNNGTINCSDDFRFGADDCEFINNGTLTIADEMAYYTHADATGIKNGITGVVTIGNRIKFESDANPATNNYIINNGLLTVTANSIEIYQGSVSITNNTTGIFNVGNDIYVDHDNARLTNSGVFTIADDLRLEGSTDDLNVINLSGGTLNYNQVEASDGDLDITNTGTINQTGEFMLNEIDNSSTFINGVNARWNYGGTNHDLDTYLDCRAVGNTFNYNRAGDQTMIDVVTDDYHHLEVTVSGTKWSADNMDIEGNLTIAGTAIFDVDAGNDNITIAGNWINTSSGGFTEGSENVTFDGLVGQFITCSTILTETYHNLFVNNVGNTITQNNNVALTNSGVLTFSSTGFININRNNFTIPNWDAGDITGYASDRFIIVDNIGFVKTTGVSAGETVNFPIGVSNAVADYAYAEITNADAVNSTFDANVCDYVNNLGTCSAGDEAVAGVVDYTWNFVSASNSAVVKVQWYSTKQLGAFNPTLCSVMHHDGISWGNLTVYAGSTTEGGGFFSRTGPANSFSPYTVADNTQPLPVGLVSFEAKTNNSEVVLNWITATESNNNYFVVERSQDGMNFTALERVDGAGNSVSINQYEYTDVNPYMGTSYYRISQVDYNGSTETFYIVSVQIKNDNKILEVDVYPNPVELGQDINIIIKGNTENQILVVLMDVVGNQYYTKAVAAFNSKDILTLSTSALPVGVYYITASQADELLTRKIVIH